VPFLFIYFPGMYLIDKGTESKENSNAGEDDTIKKRKKITKDKPVP